MIYSSETTFRHMYYGVGLQIHLTVIDGDDPLNTAGTLKLNPLRPHDASLYIHGNKT